MEAIAILALIYAPLLVIAIACSTKDRNTK